MRKVTVSRMRERYAQTVLTFRIAYVLTNASHTSYGCEALFVLIPRGPMKRIDVFKSKYGGTRLYYYKMKGNIYEMRIAVEIWATDFAIMCMAVAVSFSFHMF